MSSILFPFVAMAASLQKQNPQSQIKNFLKILRLHLTPVNPALKLLMESLLIKKKVHRFFIFYSSMTGKFPVGKCF